MFAAGEVTDRLADDERWPVAKLQIPRRNARKQGKERNTFAWISDRIRFSVVRPEKKMRLGI